MQMLNARKVSSLLTVVTLLLAIGWLEFVHY